MHQYLYKVSAPRSSMLFHPSTFWHTPDWESSTTRPREGYIADTVLYAGDFDEVNIHLFPRVRTMRIRAVDADEHVLRDLGLACAPGRRAYIFANRARKREIEAFCPTIFRFNTQGFQRVRKGEYVSWEPQEAISAETITMPVALERWNVAACYVDDLDALSATLLNKAISFDEQT